MSDQMDRKLTPYLSPAGVWALALGTSIGWGSLVITSNTYLVQAGPLGSVLGLAAGCLIMLVISRCYHYLINCFPDAGGAYAYARDAFGYDHGFLVAWFLSLTYLAILWANATALPLFARYFLGERFEFGRLYSVFGYDVYFGEALLSIAAILGAALFLMGSRRRVSALMIALAVLFSAAIVICFIAAAVRPDRPVTPHFVPDSSELLQILKIAVISPWAFIGFESVSHAAEEFSFKRNRTFRILAVSVVSTTLLYSFVMLLSVTAWPAQYDSWLAYIRDCGNLTGIEALPAFYAAEHYLGQAGVTMLMLALLALIVSSLIGNLLALSRLFYSMARDRILPGAFAQLGGEGVPRKAVWLIVGISCIIPFIGRTALGWIVDVTTLGATLIYGFVGASAVRMAKTRNDVAEKMAGMAALVIMVAFGIWLLVPNLFMTGSMAAESYILFVVWSVLGFVYFRMILRKDKQQRFGRSIIVWIALLSLILFVSLVWMNQSFMNVTGKAMSRVQESYGAAGLSEAVPGIAAEQMELIRRTNARSIIVVVGLFALSLGVLLNNYALMSRRALESEEQLGRVKDMANRDPLTGVKSKHAYAEKEKELDDVIGAGAADSFAIVICDVNGLKHVNDTYGHKAGDQYIKDACHMICEIFKHSPVYRTGGDEFAVWLQGRDFANREALMKELHDRSVRHIKSGEVVVSGGLSEYRPGEDGNVHVIFERADALMYEEKMALKAMGAITRA